MASEYGPPDIIKYLIANGANVNARDKYVRTALDITRNSEIESYLENIMKIMSYPSDKKKFKTPYAYFTWAEESLKNPPEHLPVQAVVIGILETLMGEHFGINENQIAKGKSALAIAKAIATVAKSTPDNKLTDQVFESCG